jgi:alpha-L-fucosidase 2
LNNGGYTTVYKKTESKSSHRLLASIGYDPINRSDETKEALRYLQKFEKFQETENITAHRSWWHNFYQQSFISLPDKRMENFYWIQLYKLASATRADKPMLDLMGPWTSSTPWPAIWWNLNTQLSYSPIFTSNHLDLGASLFRALNFNKKNLINNVPKKWRKDAAAIGRSSSYDLTSPISEKEISSGNFEPANLTWALYYYYQYYAYSQDISTLKSKIYPLLKKSTNFLIHLLTIDDNGVYHLPLSFSPEYKSAEDANYTLSTLNWALTTLIEINNEQKLKDKDAEKWKQIINNLTPYPIGESGYLIGKDLALTSSHRHYSHLLMIYPYHLVNWEQAENQELVQKSLSHWLSLKGALQGYTYTGGASMYATMGNGNKSYQLLNDLFSKYIQPNTLYRESGPVIETPLAAATSIQEMLLQSWGNKIRIFPAIPSSWKNLIFKQLRAEGAFLISAEMQNGLTKNIKITSLKGGSCTLMFKMENFTVKSNKRTNVAYNLSRKDSSNSMYIKTTKVGETIQLISDDAIEKASEGVNYVHFPNWHWGLNHILNDTVR